MPALLFASLFLMAGLPATQPVGLAQAVPLESDTEVGGLLARIFRQVEPSLVQVVAYRPLGSHPNLSDGEGRSSHLEPSRAVLRASGVVVGEGGLILTCAESAQPGDSLEVRLRSGQRLQALFLAQDVAAGISLIRARPVGSSNPALKPIAVPDAASVRPGEWMLVLNFDQATGEPDLRLGTMESVAPFTANGPQYLRLQLADCRGTCGAAIVDGSGGFRGMVLDVRASADDRIQSACQQTTAMLECGGVQAISATEFPGTVSYLREASGRRVGFLGVAAKVEERADDRFAHGDGRRLSVEEVVPGSPADVAGILPGDVLLEIDGVSIRDPNDITSRVASIAPGTVISVRLLRSGAPVTLLARVGDRSSLDFLFRQEEMNRRLQKKINRSIEQLKSRLDLLEQRALAIR